MCAYHTWRRNRRECCLLNKGSRVFIVLNNLLTERFVRTANHSPIIFYALLPKQQVSPASRTHSDRQPGRLSTCHECLKEKTAKPCCVVHRYSGGNVSLKHWSVTLKESWISCVVKIVLSAVPRVVIWSPAECNKRSTGPEHPPPIQYSISPDRELYSKESFLLREAIAFFQVFEIRHSWITAMQQGATGDKCARAGIIQSALSDNNIESILQGVLLTMWLIHANLVQFTQAAQAWNSDDA